MTPTPHTMPDAVRTADELRRNARPDEALALLHAWADAGGRDASYHFVLALTQYARQDLEAAVAAIDHASQLAPKHADIAFTKAQFAFESWRPAAKLFRRARRLAPNNLKLLQNLAAAESAEGHADTAIALLEEALAEQPGWVEGHRHLATVRVTSGGDDIDASFVKACEREPHNLALRLGWFHLLAQAKHWDKAETVVKEGRKIFGDIAPLETARIYLRAESGGALHQGEIFGPLAQKHDPGLDLCLVRYLLRTGAPTDAQVIAEHHVSAASARAFWPYLSLCWRLTDDPKSDWLERDGALIHTVDLDVSADELSELAATLRALHVMRQPYLEQSVRGGTQTGRNLFFNPDENVQAIRAKIIQAVREHMDALPAPDPRHPLLGRRPDAIRFSGSWSVALKRQGFHAAHTHVLGWLSSAFYVAIPEGDAMGPPPAGHLSFGRPPPELGLALEPYQTVTPRPGRLVLFPSTTWHGTEPFEEGERLTIAFDVAP